MSPPSPSAFTALAISYPYISRPARASTASRTSDESPAISSLRNLRVKGDSVVTTRFHSASLAITKFYLARTSYYAIVHSMRELRIFARAHKILKFHGNWLRGRLSEGTAERIEPLPAEPRRPCQ